MAETARLSLAALETFLAVAQEGSVSAAARRLGQSPSALSQQLSALEAALGAGLIDRSARPFGLTPAGQIFRRHAQAVIDELAQARDAVARADLSALTSFRLGMIEDFDADVTPRLLAGMAETLRTCRFSLETGASHWLLDQLDARALDMAVTADLGPGAEGFERHPLLTEPFVACVPVAEAGLPDKVLRARPYLRYTERHAMGRQIAAHLAHEGMPLESRFEIDSYHALMAMVAGGEGWTILTPLGFLCAQRFHGAVALRPLPCAALSREIVLTARKGALGEMPALVAGLLRGLIGERIVAPTAERFPFVAGALRVVG